MSPAQYTRLLLINSNLIGWKDLGSWEELGTWDSLAGFLNEKVYIGQSQTTPDNCLTIYDIGGRGNDGDCGYPSIQIALRAIDYTSGYDLLQSIKTLLDDTMNYDAKIVGYEVIGDINALGKDEKGRDMFSLNMTAITNTI